MRFSGTIFSRGTAYDTNEQPMMFAVAASHFIATLMAGRRRMISRLPSITRDGRKAA